MIRSSLTCIARCERAFCRIVPSAISYSTAIIVWNRIPNQSSPSLCGLNSNGIGYDDNNFIIKRYDNCRANSATVSSYSGKTLGHWKVWTMSKSATRYFMSASINLSPTPSNTNVLSSVLSRRQIADLEEYLYESVGNFVNDPVSGRTVNELKWTNKRIAISKRSEDGTIIIDTLLRLPSLLHPSLQELKDRFREVAQKHAKDWFIRENIGTLAQNSEVVVNVEVLPKKPVSAMARLLENPDELLSSLGPGLVSVSHIIAVYSCKGGVGKSTVAVNLAYELSAKGGRIGLLDLDLYGPSLPVLLNPHDKTIRRSSLGKGMVFPIQHEGVKVLSLGFVNQMSGVAGSGENNGAAIMKGPMAVKVATQLIKSTDWGELDVLLLDLPPGTGDIQLAVLQELQLSGAVAVTTPSRLAVADTMKGIEMFTSLGVPTMAVVENMSYFDDETGRRHFPFGKGVSEHAHGSNNHFQTIIQLPMSMATNEANETAIPLTISRPEQGANNELAAFHQLANVICKELLHIQYGNDESTKDVVRFGDDPHEFILTSIELSLDKAPDVPLAEKNFVVRIFSDSGAKQVLVIPSILRASDPRNGERIPNNPFSTKDDDTYDATQQSQDPMVERTKLKARKSPSIVPTSVSRRGRYGFQVVWQDGATIIYSNICIAKCAGAKVMSD